MSKKSKNLKFILSVVATIVCALVAATGLIIYFAKATATLAIPLALIISGGAGTLICLALMYWSIPKNVQPHDDKE